MRSQHSHRQSGRVFAVIRLILVACILAVSGAPVTVAQLAVAATPDTTYPAEYFSSTPAAPAAAAQSATTDLTPPPQGGFAKAISGVYGAYMDFLLKATKNIFGALQGSFQGFAYSIVTIYVVVVAFGMFFGRIPKDFWVSCFLVGLISALVFNVGMYQSWVLEPYVGTVNDISNFFVSKGAGVPINSQGDILNYMGSTLESIYTVSDKIERAYSSVNPLNWLTSLQIWGAQIALGGSYIACIAIYMYLILQAWFAIFMYMILGGIFLFMGSFKGTRFMTAAWFRSLCHEGLTIIFCSLIMGISGNIIQETIKSLAGIEMGVTGVLTPQFLAVILASFMGCLMLLKAPQLAGSLSGGSAGSTSGVAAAVGAAAGMGYAKLKTAGKGSLGFGYGLATGSGSKGNFGRNLGAAIHTRSLTPFSDAKGTSPTGN